MRLPRDPWSACSLVLLLGVLALMLATFLDYGLTVDEGVQNRYGRRLVRWYATLGQDKSASDTNDIFYYGGFFELTMQAALPLVSRVVPLGVYDARHLVNALFGFAGFVAAWGIGRQLAGPAGGFLSALFLVLTPQFYGHAFANPKDIPLASLFALSAWAALWASATVPRPGWREIVVTGIVIGLASGIRVAAIVLCGFTALLWLGCLWLRSREEGASRPLPGWRDLLRLGLALLGVAAIAWTVMLAFWPFGQIKPFRNPIVAFQKFSNFWEGVTVLYDGQLLIARDVPRWYLPHMYLLNLPEFYFLAWLLGGASLVALLARRAFGGADAKRRLLESLFVLSLATLPVAWVVLRRTPIFNVNRHVLFVVPFLAVLAGVSAAVFLGRPGWSRARILAAVGLGLLLLLTAVDMVQLHPYQYVYYNRLFAGGVAGAAGRYETDYWGSSYKEGIEWLLEHYPERPPRERVRVAGYSTSRVPFWYYLGRSEAGRRLFEAVEVEQSPHVVFGPTAIREHEKVEGRVLHVVERQGTPLLYIFEVRAPE
jgi:hypothetical protein